MTAGKEEIREGKEREKKERRKNEGKKTLTA